MTCIHKVPHLTVAERVEWLVSVFWPDVLWETVPEHHTRENKSIKTHAHKIFLVGFLCLFFNHMSFIWKIIQEDKITMWVIIQRISALTLLPNISKQRQREHAPSLSHNNNKSSCLSSTLISALNLRLVKYYEFLLYNIYIYANTDTCIYTIWRVFECYRLIYLQQWTSNPLRD